ncbi:L domain-like protein [Neocallimastix lanati (nom. inval.)]|nr:L domain-like protein [Neocallimastix sp. JGI-2020a]
MKLKYIFNLLLVFIPLVLSSECNSIDKSILHSINKCSTNEEGKIIGLTITNRNLNEEQVNQLLTYNLTELSYTILMEDGETYETHIPEHPGYSKVPPTINNLKNLESLKIHFDSYLHPCSFDCAYRGISFIEKNILKDLKKLKNLYIGGIKVSQENIDEISTLENLESLIFVNSYLDDSLNYKPLGNLNNLTKLEINNIRDRYISVDDIGYSRNIPKSLVISNKGIKDLTMNLGAVNITKNDLPNLEKLTIGFDYDFDTSFVEQFNSLTDLSFSYVGHGMGSKSYNDIKGDLSKLKNLNSLYLNGVDNAKEILSEVINLPNFEKLYLVFINTNGISEILKSLKNITTLEINNIYEKEMDSAIESLTKLRHLAIVRNFNGRMSRIPKYIYSFKNLEYLDLSNNEIKLIDEELKNLENLKYLDLSNNELISIPLELMNLKKLEYLNLSNNKIKDDSPIFLNKFENLKDFYIQDNIDIKGKIIVNENLIECDYNDSYNLCIPKTIKEVKCLNPNIKFETCEDDDIKESTNGLCGQENGRCPYGQCCSKDGKCGSTEDHCFISQNCQMKYGRCIDECKEFLEYINKNSIGEVTCEINEEGKATMVEVNRYSDEKNIQLIINHLPTLHNLEKLILSFLDFEIDDLEPLKKIEKLTDLKLSSHSFGGEKSTLYEFPEIVFSLTNLKRLEIYNNKIKSIPDDISKLENLEYLGLSLNEITDVSPKIGELKHLKEIDLSFCKIKELPVEFGNIKTLEILNLENSDIYYRLSKVPKEIGNLSQLESLYMERNEIKELPEEYGNLKNLKILDLYYNELKKFPELIGKLEKLEILKLNSNFIDDEIPKSYNNLSNLTEIDTTYNKDIRGEILINKNLIVCDYETFSNKDKVYSLCRHGDETCLNKDLLKYYKLCENSSAVTNTITTTTTTAVKPSTTTITITTTITTTEAVQPSTTTTTTTTVKPSTTTTTTTTVKPSTTTTTTTVKPSTTASTTISSTEKSIKTSTKASTKTSTKKCTKKTTKKCTKKTTKKCTKKNYKKMC